MSNELVWARVLAASAIEAGWVTPVQLGGRDYAIYDTPSGLFASLGYCTHGGAALCDGYFDGHTIECPLHQGCFDVRTGAATGAPATRALRTVSVRIRDEMVELGLPA
jgi:naphthalene 1,2-dioxygenase ferredoxin component